MIVCSIKGLLISHILIGDKRIRNFIISVTYITPSSFRKVVNQSVIISYLEYLQQKGYNRVSIWMCPSTKGDDYIFVISNEGTNT